MGYQLKLPGPEDLGFVKDGEAAGGLHCSSGRSVAGFVPFSLLGEKRHPKSADSTRKEAPRPSSLGYLLRASVSSSEIELESMHHVTQKE